MSVLSAPLAAQWVNQPTPGIPRTAEGKPNLTAPAPRTPDGKPDFSGLWTRTSRTVAADLKPVQPWVNALVQQRTEDLGKDNMTVLCLPLGPMYVTTRGADRNLGGMTKVVQTPGLILVLNGDLTYRQIFMDGRALETNPNPSWMGYSVGHWEGDTLVVESNGFNDRTWLDFGGHPHTEALRVIERLHRSTIGQMDIQVTLTDPGAYKRPWTVPVAATLAPDTDILEYVCNENEARRLSIGLSQAEKSVVVPRALLADYVGTYENTSGRPPIGRLTIRMGASEIVLDIDGKGNIPLTPLSSTMFSTRLVTVEFIRNQAGVVTHLINTQNGVQFVRRP